MAATTKALMKILKTLWISRQNTDYTKATRYSRTFYLKLAFIIGSRIKEDKPVGKKLFEELLQKAGKRRLNVSDVEKVEFEELKQTTDFWHKAYHGGQKEHKIKKQKLWEKFCIEATSYWRSCL